MDRLPAEVVKLKSGSVASIKPVVAAADTNMTIYTDRRVYSFDLHSAGPAAPGAGSVFRSVFTYPAERKAKVIPPADATQINSDYLVSGEGAFRPKWVQDNGRQTTFFLPKNAPRPAIFKVGADKTEELINSRTSGDRIIVDGTANFWVLLPCCSLHDGNGGRQRVIGRNGFQRIRLGFDRNQRNRLGRSFRRCGAY